MTYKNGEGYPDHTAGQAINGVRWEELQRMREETHGIRRGDCYLQEVRERDEERGLLIRKKERWKVLALHKNLVLMENKCRIRRSFTYWEINTYLRKETP